MQITGIKSIKSIGVVDTLDLEVDNKHHNFLGEGVVISNSHSYSYSTMAAKLVYLKFNHPKEFYLGCLKMAQDRADCAEEINEISKEMRYLGYDLLPPDILKSSIDFTVEGGGIRFGLGSVKGIAEKAIPKLKKFIKSEASNKFEVFNASRMAKINIGIFSSLIQAGAINSLSSDRPKTVLEAQIWGLLTDREKKYCLENGATYKFDLLSMLKNYSEWKDSKGVVIKDSRIETIRKHFAGYWKIYQQNAQYSKLAAYFYEKKALGYSYTYSLKDIFEYKNDYLANTKQIKNNKTERDKIDFVGEVISLTRAISAKGEEYLKMVVGDEFGNQEFMFYGYKFTKYLKEGGEVPEENSIVYIEGSKGTDIVWVDKMAVQDYNIYTKLSDLKNDE
jgi:DNA polymerase III alpha subunit